MFKFLHVGCGPQKKDRTTEIFKDWEEVRLDIDEGANPDILASMTDLSMINDNEFDGIYSSHNIEHLYPHEVEPTLKEFNRVVNKTARVIINCPDLLGIAKEIVKGNVVGKWYDAPSGPITPIDALYGYRKELARGKLYMAHKCNFTLDLLLGLLKGASFTSCVGCSDGINLYTISTKEKVEGDQLLFELGEHLGVDLLARKNKNNENLNNESN